MFQFEEKENNFLVTILCSLIKEGLVISLSDFKALKNIKGEDYILSLIKEYENYLLNKIFSIIR
ncbi:hypothetical protein [Borreliella garinii]|uniref:hypothetical protein n=1 Tax=Borreliella garinii TaxID=29519 RepID=UPI001AED7546|nr:hypothetical protein [Borreliella garinii]